MDPVWGPNAQKQMNHYAGQVFTAKERAEMAFRERELQSRALDRAESRAERRYLHGVTRDEKLQDKLDKKKVMMNEIEDRRGNINSAISELNTMIDNKGTWELLGSHNQDLDRKVEQIATDMAKLQDPNSVARPSEVEAVKKSLIQSGFQNRNSTAKEILKNFEGEVKRRADSAYKVRGLEVPTQQVNTQERTVLKTQTNAKTGQKRIIYSDGSVEVLDVPVAGGR
jgi:hypothetical protein